MTDSQAHFIDVAQLRIGLYVYLDLGWMDHPFALNSFRITTEEQIRTLRGLGIERIRYAPELSDPPTSAEAAVTPSPATAATTSAGRAAAPAAAPDAAPDIVTVAEDETARQQRRLQLSAQRAGLQRCENQFAEATRSFRQILELARAQPEAARAQGEAMVDGLLGRMGGQDEDCYVRLLSEKAGEKTSLHSINVTVIALLLGKALGLPAGQMRELGIGALLHDVGKLDLPERLRWRDSHFTTAERQLYREHVGHGVDLARKMGLDTGVQALIAQHHEFSDGSGYPLQLKGEQISPTARAVCLVNQYDNLCNPGNPALAVTPHEALAMIYAQMKKQFDLRTLSAFIHMMGVYPPGSVVELSDARHAMVVSVNSSRPLRPRIIIHDPRVPADEALIVDLETATDLGIRRSVKPIQLPRATFDYLSPRKRLCYFFERSLDGGATEDAA